MGHTANSIHSTAREHIAEHAFLAVMGQFIWQKNVLSDGEPMGVLRAEADNDGFDVLLSLEGVHRAVQLKTTSLDGRTSRYSINRKLARAPGGCVIVLIVDDAITLNHFLFLESDEAANAVDLDGYKSAKHTKGNRLGIKTERSGIATVPRGEFTKYESVGELAEALFGA
ncbi:MAG: hypothetical protein AAF666_16290 [Pseudomonadota bacterium]